MVLELQVLLDILETGITRGSSNFPQVGQAGISPQSTIACLSALFSHAVSQGNWNNFSNLRGAPANLRKGRSDVQALNPIEMAGFQRLLAMLLSSEDWFMWKCIMKGHMSHEAKY